MPYARRYRRRPLRRRRRTPWYNKRYSALQLASKALRSTRYLRGLVNSEMFHKDEAYALGAQQSGIAPITNLSIGDSVNNRTGNSVLLKSFAANGYMYINASQTTNTRCMIAIVLDKQQVSDTVPSISDIFVDPNSPHTLLNQNNLGRFTILYRRQYTLDSNVAGSSARQFKIYKRLGFHTRYNGSSASDIQKNGLYIVLISSEPTLFPTINMQSRLSYHDN